jgi:hypothetical protein
MSGSLRGTLCRQLLGTVLLLTPLPALSQTVGQILDKGAQKLDATALRAAVSGATMRGRLASGFDFTAQYNADGTLSATASLGAKTDTSKGTWTINDAGQLCAEQRFSSGGGSKTCNFWFKQGEDFYSAPTESREQATARRSLSR